MTDEIYFSDVLDIGNLYLYNTLIYYDQPTLFVCKDDNDYLYLCSYKKVKNMNTWLIVPIPNDVPDKLLNSEISVYKVYQRSTFPIILIMEKNSNRIIERNNFAQINKIYLPEKASYLNN